MNQNRLIGKVSGDSINKAVLRFFRKDASFDDTLLFYFSGHGLSDGYGAHFLGSTDIDINLPDENGYRFDVLEDQIKKALQVR